MELFCGSCQYPISGEEAQMGLLEVKDKEDGKREILIECPECGHINYIYTKHD